jgi:hypothetical protein
MMPRRWLLGVLPLAILLVAALADARPGGGHTSSGSFSSSHSSSGGGFSSSHSSSSGGSHYSGGGYYYGGGGDINGGIVVLGLLLVVVVVAAAAAASSAKNREWSSNFAMMPEPTPDPGEAWPARRPALDLGPLMARDPGFSRAVFEDFAFELYAAAQRERGDSKLQRLQPYLSPAAFDQLGARGVAPQQVVIGTLQIEDHAVEPPRDQIRVRIEATHIGTRAPVYVVEHWVFARSVEARSRPPERTRTWPCPNCGAPWQPSPTRQCAHCGQAVEVGKFDWCVEDISVASETRALASLTGTVPEYGNDLPTVVDPAAHAMLGQISADDPAVTLETLQPRILLVYQQLNTAWNARDLPPVRGFVTAALRNYLEYWLHEYDHQGLHNTLTDARVSQIDLAKVTRDRYYDAITVRIFADGFDVTRDARGKIVGGSTDERRAYTEYWTFLRSSTRRGPVTATPACPNCGAPLDISDIGDCTHCGVAVENGSFDWTLSKIEQDDNYTG